MEQPPQPPAAGILVTGAGGFIGTHLVARLLARGERVRVLVRRQPTAPWRDDPRVDVVTGDLADSAAVARAMDSVRLVYHLGAAMRGSADEFERSTIVGTQNVVNGILATGVARLVYVSSLSVLHAAAATTDSIVREDWPLEPHAELRGLYTSTKLRAEQLVTQAVRGQGLRAVIIRPGQVFGPGAALMTPAVARQAGNRLIVIGNGRVVLPLIFVDDLIDALIASADRDVFHGAIFHIVDSATVTQNELAGRCRHVLPGHPRVVHIPKAIMLAAGAAVQCVAAMTGRKPPLSPYRLASALAPLRFDCSAARTHLGWSPIVGVARGLDVVLQAEQRPATTDAERNRP